MTDSLSKKLSASKVIAKKARSAQSPAASLDHLAAGARDVDDCCSADAAPDASASPTSPTKCHDNDKEYQVDHPTGDRMRDKVRKLLCSALFQTGEDLVKKQEEAEVVANAIENRMFTNFGKVDPAYKAKYRNISFNLKDKKNKKLRMYVLERHIPPSELLEMSNEDLANDELKRNREIVHEKMTRDAMPYNKQEASTDMFKCGKCKQRKTTYYQMQTRSADEPLTTFVSCVVCGNRWRF